MQVGILFALAALVASSTAQIGSSGTGTTTRYWDCCKPSCGWKNNMAKTGTGFAKACLGGTSLGSNNGVSSPSPDSSNNQNTCGGGGNSPAVFTCNNNQPFNQSGIGYGFAATSFGVCCACYKLTFTSGPVSGQVMYVQATNTGSDVSSTNHQFDLNIPGGGVGIYNGCTTQWGAPSGGWGAQYGGVSSRANCAQLPAALQPGCNFRFDWFKGADNPTMNWTQVTCPSQLTSISGCSD